MVRAWDQPEFDLRPASFRAAARARCGSATPWCPLRRGREGTAGRRGGPGPTGRRRGAIRAGRGAAPSSSARGYGDRAGRSRPRRRRSLGPYQATAPADAGSVGERASSAARWPPADSPHTTVRRGVDAEFARSAVRASRSAARRSSSGPGSGFAAEPVVDATATANPAAARRSKGPGPSDASGGPCPRGAPGARRRRGRRAPAGRGRPGRTAGSHRSSSSGRLPSMCRVRHAAQQADSGSHRGRGRQRRDVRVGRGDHLAQGGRCGHRVRHWCPGGSARRTAAARWRTCRVRGRRAPAGGRGARPVRRGSRRTARRCLRVRRPRRRPAVVALDAVGVRAVLRHEAEVAGRQQLLLLRAFGVLDEEPDRAVGHEEDLVGVAVEMGRDDVALGALAGEEVEGVLRLLAAGVDGEQIGEEVGAVAHALLDEVRLAGLVGMREERR